MILALIHRKIKKGIKHIYGRIGTLPYYYNYNEILPLFKKDEELIITPKFDGINFVAYFKKGKFKTCATRGNGSTGKNISWAFNKKISLPKEFQKQSFAINGEVIYLGNPQKEDRFRDKVACYLNKKNNTEFMEVNFIYVLVQ